jgi:exonuclease III
MLNGRYVGDILGNMTCFNSKGCSLIDYAVASMSLLPSVEYFMVKNATYFSDHCQLVTHLNCNLNIVDQHDDYVKHEFAFQWTRLLKMLLEKELSEKNVYENIIEFGITNFEKSSSGVNKANEIITHINTDLSEKCMKKKIL